MPQVTERKDVRDQVVLVVDDEPANQRAVRRALRDDCNVLTASGGEEALTILSIEPVALVITDQRMPGMSGTRLLAETVRDHPHLIRVVLTAYTDVETLLDAINGGHVYHFLAKPWETRELRQVVRRGLERYCAEMERIRLVEELEVAWGRARREAEQKGALLTMTAHELGTPLHILLNSLDLLRETAATPPIAVQWLDTAQRATRWLVRGVEQMHRAGQVQAESLRLQCEIVDLVVLLRTMVAELVEQTTHRKLSIETSAPSQLFVWADPRWMRHAIWALLSNAVRFTADGGSIQVVANDEEEVAVVTVSDSGIGIATEHLERIFEPFSAAMGDPLVHSSGLFTFGARGLGLGLSTVKGILQAHGGAVGVESSLGGGSRFTFRIPTMDPRKDGDVPAGFTR